MARFSWVCMMITENCGKSKIKQVVYRHYFQKQKL